MKLIASDLDGTLLVANNEIGTENIKALEYIQNKGIKFVASSGRSYTSISSIFKNSPIKPDYIISCNGSLILSNDGEELKKTPLDKNVARIILSYLEDNNFCYSIGCKNAMYSLKSSYTRIKNEYENAHSYGDNTITGSLTDFYDLFQIKEGVIQIDSYKDIIDTDEAILSIICISIDKNRLLEGENALKSVKGITMESSAFNNFEIFHESSSKGSALEFLSNTLKISLDETMALGDNYNDISMLKVANISVAMGNAHDNIKKQCNFITKKNTENGFAHAIYKFIE